MTLYATGGFYNFGKGDRHFALVKPSGRDAVPYITRNSQNKLFYHTKHHSHLYQLQLDPDWGVTAFLQRLSYEAEVNGVESLDGATEIKLPAEEAALVCSAIVNHIYWELN